MFYFDTKLIQKVKTLLINTNLSERLVTAKAETNRNTVRRIKTKCTIKTRKCQTVPKYNESQQKRAKTNCRKVYRDSLHKQR